MVDDRLNLTAEHLREILSYDPLTGVGKKGVSRKTKGKPWQAHIRHGGRSLYLGTYDTVDEAHAAYVTAARKYKGEFARAE